MPKKVVAPKDVFAAIQGRTPGLGDVLSGNRDCPKSAPISFIGSTLGTATSEVTLVCNDRELIRAAIEERQPLLLRVPDLYLFGRRVWLISKVEQTCNCDQLRLVFLEAVDKERDKWERLKRKFSGVAGEAIEYVREPIPESVRIFVWRRDQGCCVKCGSQERLEFDHMIPVCKGGSNTARNIQLLCESCNRTKSSKV